VGSELFIAEPPALGGFGFSDQGALYNEDTVKFFNVLVGLQDAAVLQDFRAPARRRLVWEIGGGWGGFAYRFTRVCPNVTYVISAPPSLFLLSAVYLTSMCPEARCRFYEPASAGSLERDWQDLDFIFVPAGAVESISLPRLDLTIDVRALAAMTAARADQYVRRAYELGSRFFYTLLPVDRQVSPVADAIARHFWPHPVPPRRDPKVTNASGEPADSPYRHLVGWRRLQV
jgi:hypothetical protein